MTYPEILAPVFALVLLLFVLLFWMGRERFVAARQGEVKPGPGSPRTFGWPRRAQQVGDCFHLQLELPMLFYVLVPLAMLTKKADLMFVAMSWIFVVSRYLHAVEHTGPNRLKFRFPLFAFGAVTLLAMWLIFALRILVLE